MVHVGGREQSKLVVISERRARELHHTSATVSRETLCKARFLEVVRRQFRSMSQVRIRWGVGGEVRDLEREIVS